MFWKKKKRIETLEKQFHECDMELKNEKIRTGCLESEVEELKKKISGERVCDGYCTVCKNSYNYENAYGNKIYGCALDCMCRDFKREEGRWMYDTEWISGTCGENNQSKPE